MDAKGTRDRPWWWRLCDLCIAPRESGPVDLGEPGAYHPSPAFATAFRASTLRAAATSAVVEGSATSAVAEQPGVTKPPGVAKSAVAKPAPRRRTKNFENLCQI